LWDILIKREQAQKAHLWFLYNRDNPVFWRSKKQNVVVRSHEELQYRVWL